MTKLRYTGLGILATSNPELPGLGTLAYLLWRRAILNYQGYPGLGTLATSNPELLSLITLAYVPWRRAILNYQAQVSLLRYPGDKQF